MADDIYGKIYSSSPINATAGRVTSRGIHWSSGRKPGDTGHWTAPLPLAPMPIGNPSFKNMTGKSFGRFVVIGYIGKGAGKHSTGRWLVKCSCGDYEARSAKAIANPNNANDMCVECRHLEYIKTHEGRGKGVFVWGKKGD